MIPPKQYEARKVENERNKELNIRQMERQIRTAKRKAMLASNKEERKKWTEASKALQDTYWDYCKKNDYAVAEWRTRISLNERVGMASGLISGGNNEYIPNKYFNGGSKAINKNQYAKYSTNLNDKFTEKIYRLSERDLKAEEKIINFVGKTNSINNKIKDITQVDDDAIIFFRNATATTQGSAEHIIADHGKQITRGFLNAFKEAINNPDEVVVQKKRRYILLKYNQYKIKNKEQDFIVVLYKQNKKKLAIITAYPKKHNKKEK